MKTRENCVDFLIYLYIYILQNVHQGYPHEALMRFLKAREGNVSKAHKMVRLNLFFLNKSRL